MRGCPRYSFNKIKYSNWLTYIIEKILFTDGIICSPAAGDTLHVFLPDGDITYSLPEHQDYQYLMQSPNQITCYIGVTDYNENVGGLEFWLGSNDKGIRNSYKNENGFFKITDCDDLNNYETNFYSFLEYRETIRNEKNKFKKEIIDFVEKIKINKFYNSDLGINSKHLYDIVTLQKNSIFVDLGVRGGVSSEIMLFNSKNNNNRVYGIDVDFSLTDTNVLNNKTYTPILGDSVTVGKEWNNSNKVKILFVDTFHIKEQVLCELYYWFNHMEDDSYIVFHDTHWPEGKHDEYGGIIWDRVEEAIKEYFKLDKLENILRDDIDVKCYPQSYGMVFIHIKNKNNFKQNNINWNDVFEKRNKLISMFWNEENILNVKLELNILPK
jgi:hypothetical protein